MCSSAKGLAVVEHACDRAADKACTETSACFLTGYLHIALYRVGQACNGECLQPYPSGTGQGSQEDAIAAKEHVADAGNACDLK